MDNQLEYSPLGRHFLHSQLYSAACSSLYRTMGLWPLSVQLGEPIGVVWELLFALWCMGLGPNHFGSKTHFILLC